MLKPSFLALAMVLGVAAAPTQPVQFDPGHLKGPQHGMPNQLLVLGTTHLSQMPKPVPAAALVPLMAHLKAWRPQAIGIEQVSGVECDFMRRYPTRYSESIPDYCGDTSAARLATGLDVPSATAQAKTLLDNWPDHPTAAQRRHLAALFLAGGNPVSALVQWLRLPTAERHAGDGLNDALVKRLEKLRTDQNEDTRIAAPLAAELGLEQVYPVDDHLADSPTPDRKAYGAALVKAWNNPATEKRKVRDGRLETNATSGAGIMALYRTLNAPSEGMLTFHSDFGAALEEPSPQQFGRQYVGYWETRNLQIAANIRSVFSNRPGIRMLVIIGASHKPYLDAYLNEMHDMQIVSAEKVLR
ncbi:DUF5694 domain-containing protein [Stakelama sediminis]|uniref:TraB/GumN family protein n=1 Tax=Stakelama sediminis TaxID=463200 RepID=A0A840YU46_9SPHN|nr:DUF5694 domain-containing protein [Stakelama sediminis]MBB5717112.1 hypothetical protein [Stakelama sediminis]